MTLPPLPTRPGVEFGSYSSDQITAYGQQCYQAGRESMRLDAILAADQQCGPRAQDVADAVELIE